MSAHTELVVNRSSAMIAAAHDMTLWTAKVTALACSISAAGYAAAQLDPSPRAALFLSGGPLIAVILWLQKDAQRTGDGALLDWGLFLWIAWPVLIPWYAWKTRGRGGWRLALGLIGLILSPFVTGAVVSWLIYGVQYAIWHFRTGA
jgi:hypothetical protein